MAQAAPILGGKLFYTGGTINVTMLEKFASFDSELWLYDDLLVTQLLTPIVLASATGTSVN